MAPSKGNNNPKKKKPFNFYWIYAIIALVLILLQVFSWTGSTREITESEFTRLANVGAVEKIKIVNQKTAQVYLKEEAADSLKENDEQYKNLSTESNYGAKGPELKFNIPPAENYREELKKLQTKLESKGEKFTFEQEWAIEENWGREILSWLIPIGIMVLIWVFIMRRMSGGGGGGGQLFNIGKSKAQVFEKGKGTNVTFKDVAGLVGAKEEIEEIVSFLKNPKRYTKLGAKIPKGALLVGPPGTGKTLLAKAVAGEAQVPFFSLSGSDFVEMFVGVGASRVRDLFKQAKEKAPCIIFIDEIDAIGRARGKSASMGSNDERENTLNQLLTEMDGFGTNSGVIILAATNRADVLDSALMRAGRFDRQIHVDMPDLNERKEIFAVHLKPLKLDKKIDVDFLAKQTPGFSGADIANLCNEAALIAARKDKESIELQDFLDAVDRIIDGLEKKNKIISKQEKKTIAYHEAGHATVSWLLEYASPLVKVTIVPRGQSLGAAWYLPEERSLTTTEQILDDMCAALGGRAAEEITFGRISTGALSDLEKVTKQATAIVTIYGMNDKIGNRSYYDSQSGNGYGFTKPYSEETAKIIDQEVSKVIESQYERAKKILTENKDKLEKLADYLLDKEVIFKENLVKIFGERPWDPKEDIKETLSTKIEENKKEAESTEKVESTSELKKDTPLTEAPNFDKKEDSEKEADSKAKSEEKKDE